MKLYTVISVVLCAALLTNADHLHEIRVLTSNCGDCGMAAFFGQLSVKVCSENAVAPSICCVAANIASDSKFRAGEQYVFAGDSLKECYNFDLGSVTTADDIGLTIYHSLFDAGKFDWVETRVGDDSVYRCYFEDWLNNDEYLVGKNCTKLN